MGLARSKTEPQSAPGQVRRRLTSAIRLPAEDARVRVPERQQSGGAQVATRHRVVKSVPFPWCQGPRVCPCSQEREEGDVPSGFGGNVDRTEPIAVARFHVGAVARKQGEKVALRGKAGETREGGGVLSSFDH